MMLTKAWHSTPLSLMASITSSTACILFRWFAFLVGDILQGDFLTTSKCPLDRFYNSIECNPAHHNNPPKCTCDPLNAPKAPPEAACGRLNDSASSGERARSELAGVFDSSSAAAAARRFFRTFSMKNSPAYQFIAPNPHQLLRFHRIRRSAKHDPKHTL